MRLIKRADFPAGFSHYIVKDNKRHHRQSKKARIFRKSMGIITLPCLRLTHRTYFLNYRID
jgi:glutaredoxin